MTEACVRLKLEVDEFNRLTRTKGDNPQYQEANDQALEKPVGLQNCQQIATPILPQVEEHQNGDMPCEGQKGIVERRSNRK